MWSRAASGCPHVLAMLPRAGRHEVKPKADGRSEAETRITGVCGWSCRLGKNVGGPLRSNSKKKGEQRARSTATVTASLSSDV